MEIIKKLSEEYIEEGRRRISWTYNNEAMNEFASRYPWYHEQAISWEPKRLGEVIVCLEDGRSCLYDNHEKRLYFLKFFDRPSELDEEEWINGFARLLNEALWRSQKTQKELAMEVGVTKSMINRYCGGQSIPSIFLTQRIAESLNCDIRDLLPRDYIMLEQ